MFPRPSFYRTTAGGVVVALWAAAIVYVLAVSSLAGAGIRVVTGAAVVEQIVFLLLWAIATPGIIWTAAWLPIDRARWHRVAMHLAIAVAFILLLNVVAPTITWLLLGLRTSFGSVMRRGFVELIGVGHLALVVYAFILGTGHYLHTLDVRRREQLRSEQLRADLASAQLRALTLQLQPHFLFNALNTVGALVLTERNREAFDVIGRLGELLRALLAIERREEVMLREELELAESYVGIEKARLADRLRVTWEIAPDIGSAQLPPMLLQPLVENAVRHGIARVPSGGRLTISAHRAESKLILEVRDDGPGPSLSLARDGSATGGLGLENTRQRLRHLYGDGCALTLLRDDGWTKVRVELPYHVLANVTHSNVEGSVGAVA